MKFKKGIPQLLIYSVLCFYFSYHSYFRIDISWWCLGSLHAAAQRRSKTASPQETKAQLWHGGAPRLLLIRRLWHGSSMAAASTTEHYFSPSAYATAGGLSSTRYEPRASWEIWHHISKNNKVVYACLLNFIEHSTTRTAMLLKDNSSHVWYLMHAYYLMYV